MLLWEETGESTIGTHRVAITNNRIISIDNGKVTFTYRDRQDNNKIKPMGLTADEFIGRFLLHVLPRGFMKIRYFGFLAHTNKKQAVALVRRLLSLIHAILKKRTVRVMFSTLF